MARRGRKRRFQQSEGSQRTSQGYAQPSPDDDSQEFPTESFVKEFCATHGLVPESCLGTSPSEKFCAAKAAEARAQFKSLLNAEELNEDVQSLDKEQKYNRRLRRNRLSAACSKVSESVLMRAQATLLQNVSVATNFELNQRIRFLENDRQGLLQHITLLNEALQAERKQYEELLNSSSNLSVQVQGTTRNVLQNRREEEEAERADEIQPVSAPQASQGVDIYQQLRRELGNKAQFCAKSLPDSSTLQVSTAQVEANQELHQRNADELRRISVNQPHPSPVLDGGLDPRVIPHSSNRGPQNTFQLQANRCNSEAIQNQPTRRNNAHGDQEQHPRFDSTQQNVRTSQSEAPPDLCNRTGNYPRVVPENQQLQRTVTNSVTVTSSRPLPVTNATNDSEAICSTADHESQNLLSNAACCGVPSSQALPITNTHDNFASVTPVMQSNETCGSPSNPSCTGWKRQSEAVGNMCAPTSSLPIFSTGDLADLGSLEPIHEVPSHLLPIFPIDDFGDEDSPTDSSRANFKEPEP